MSQLIAFAAPIQPGKTQQWKQFITKLNGEFKSDFQESRRKLGIQERTFFQTTPDMDLVVVTLEGSDPLSAFQKMANAQDTFTKWFVQQVIEIHGFDLREPMKGNPPELIVDSGRI